MARRLVYLMLGFWITFAACAIGYGQRSVPIDQRVMDQMNQIYDPYQEKAWCLKDSQVTNILIGDWMSCPMPLCSPGSIVIHTHPAWAEGVPNVLDGLTWDEYQARYGGYRFGVMTGLGDLKVYARE
jgi:hypothetical protein